MHAVVRPDSTLDHLIREQRATPRSASTLPILVVLGGKKYTAALRNISTTGAMIVTSAPLTTRSRIEFQCGTICCRGIVLWQRQSAFGINFRKPICEWEFSEQIARSLAVEKRQALRPQTIVQLDCAATSGEPSTTNVNLAWKADI